jgi:hypothetical protein
MADYHSVDSGDQQLAAEGIADHSDLTTFYAEAKHAVLGPWMQENERQAMLQKEREKIVLTLRRSSLLVGISVSLPVVVGIVLGQFFMTHVTLKNAIPFLFLIIFGFGGLLGMTIALLRWVGKTFNDHNIRALPITLTTLLCLFLVLQRVFDLFDGLIGGLIGYVAALGALVLIGIVIATITIFVWTIPKLSGLAKLIILVAFIGVSSAIFSLA